MQLLQVPLQFGSTKPLASSSDGEAELLTSTLQPAQEPQFDAPAPAEEMDSEMNEKIDFLVNAHHTVLHTHKFLNVSDVPLQKTTVQGSAKCST